jgi:glutamate/tyrosine decarboxylase-like PLP-dependent enzyme
VANAGTVNTTDFDDLEALAALKERFWLHVDGAFGLFAACSPRFQHLVRGVEAADSITVDAHKWLNVPYDSAIQLTRHLQPQMDVFQNVSPYLGRPEPLPHNYLHLVPENSRRFRALAAWMTLAAYGREGYRSIIEENCDRAAELARLLDGSELFRQLAPTRLNVVCFALRDGDTSAFLEQVRDDGRAFLTATVYRGAPAIRAAFSNWRTRPEDVELIFEAVVDAARAVRPS